MANFDFDVAVVGGGVVGLAVLHKCARKGLAVVLLERHPAVGRETSSRNSEVIHGGMYYAPGSLKARLSVAGRRQFYRFAAEHGIPHARCGKIIVAVTGEEVAGLEAILATGRLNDVEDLRLLRAREVAAMAPGVKAAAGLYSPATGVASAHAFMDALARISQEDGGLLVCGATVNSLEPVPGGWEVGCRDADGQSVFRCRAVVNAAGLGAQKVMAMAGLDPVSADLKLYPCKGSYFSVGGASRAKIRSLVYPAPEPNLTGLGIHTIVDFAGGVKLGPDTRYVDEAEQYHYAVDASLAPLFHERAVRYLPFLRPEDIQPDMSGIRPKLSGPGQPPRDFHIADETERGLPNFINLAGIESPGLTASLAIADMVCGMVSG